VRLTELSACASSSGCYLRSGTTCCGCGSDTLIAVSGSANVEQVFCAPAAGCGADCAAPRRRRTRPHNARAATVRSTTESTPLIRSFAGRALLTPLTRVNAFCATERHSLDDATALARVNAFARCDRPLRQRDVARAGQCIYIIEFDFLIIAS
jgi:hypothetical protein